MPQMTLQQAIELGLRHHRAGELAQAEAIYRQILSTIPDQPEATNLLGALAFQVGRLDVSIPLLRRAIEIKPQLPEAHANLGSALLQNGQYDDAIALFRHAISMRREFPMAHHNLGLALLLKGEFDEGWSEYAWRDRAEELGRVHQKFPQPQWRGESLDGKRILLHAEQGVGDTIQLVRFIPEVIARGGRVILAVQEEVLSLVRQIPGVMQFATRGDPIPEFDVHSPLLNLPGALAITRDTIPSSEKYLSADAALVKEWETKLSAPPRHRKIGLAWAGDPRHTNDRNRSIAAEMLAPFQTIADTTFYRLHKSGSAGPAWIVDHTPGFRDFSDTAAFIENLDLVISVDTAVAHLAAAMGKPTWILLPFVPDWRWMLERTDSPWYPSVRLFRQSSIGDWRNVMEQVKIAMAKGKI